MRKEVWLADSTCSAVCRLHLPRTPKVQVFLERTNPLRARFVDARGSMEFVPHHIKPTVAGNIRDHPEPLAWSPAKGGWVKEQQGSPQSYLQAPREFRTSLDPDAGVNGGWGFGGRAPLVAAMGGYGVKDKSAETYAYSGARGIFQQTEKYVPPHYITANAHEYVRPASAVGTEMAPGTSTALKGGWPTATTYGQKPFSPGWSIEKDSRPVKPHWISRASA